MKKGMRALLFILMAAVLCFSAFAEGDLEEVSIFIYDADGSVAGEIQDAFAEPEEEKPDPSEPVYEKDGSILLTMSFTGDLTIGSNLQSSGASIFEKELKKQGGDITFTMRNVKDILLNDDLTMVNFEGTLTTCGKNRAKLNNDFLFRADPSYVKMLTAGGIDTVSLENNHVLDMGTDGLAETKQVLTNAGIPYASENEPAILTVKGIRIGSLAYQTFGGRHDEIIARLPADIGALREAGCEIVIVSYHWGSELDYAPNDKQIKLGRATIDAGADLVIGHHSHRINPIEYYNGHYICYSLGNFSFAGNNKPNDMSSFIFQIRMRKDEGEITSEKIRIIPCRISSRTDYNDFAPTPYTKDANIEAVLKVLRNNGKKLEYVIDSYPLKWKDEV